MVKSRRSAPPAVQNPPRQLRGQNVQHQQNERRLAPARLVEIPNERAREPQQNGRADAAAVENVQVQPVMPAGGNGPNEGVERNQGQDNQVQVREIVQAVITGLLPLLPEAVERRAEPPAAQGRAEPPAAQGRAEPPAAQGRAQPPAAQGRADPPAPQGRAGLVAGLHQAPPPQHARPPVQPPAPAAENEVNEVRNGNNVQPNEELARVRRLLRNSQDANRNLQQRLNEQEYYVRQLERRYDNLMQQQNNYQGHGHRQRQGQGQHPRQRQGQGQGPRPY